jgi:predicted amino acid-binding ACT domain protein
MMMIVDVSGNEDLEKLEKQFDGVRKEMSLQIHIQLEDIFKTMHRV